ncbi:MAG: ABC transporter permease [Ignavibacterium sp.]|nr:MAG: ABC transporter permease [Ignavibacterium sp.]
MGFESFIAKRYLISKHKINFITIISIISIAGITIGVAALIIVLSVFNGFGTLVTTYLMNFEPHLRVQIVSEEGEKNREQAFNVIDKSVNVDEFTSYVDGKVLAYNKGLTRVVNFKGIESIIADRVYNFKPSILYGEEEIASSKPLPKVIIGIQLADKLQSIVGDTITLISPVGIEQAITQLTMPLTKRVIISGIYSSKNNDYDERYIIGDLEFAQFLLGYKKRIRGYDVRLKDSGDAFSIQNDWRDILSGEEFTVNTWYDFHQELYSVMKIERWTAYIILSLIIAVATFNILGSLSMSVIEKRRDIGILNAMGISQKSVLKIFMFEGILIGVIGTLLGVIIGYLLCYLQIEYNIYPLDPTQYKINALPVELRFSDFFFISGAAMLLSFLAALYPAKRAAKINPLEAIKWE